MHRRKQIIRGATSHIRPKAAGKHIKRSGDRIQHETPQYQTIVDLAKLDTQCRNDIRR